MSRAVAMNKRPRLHSDPMIDSSLTLLVRSMRTALGPADEDVFDENQHPPQTSNTPLNASAPLAAIVRVATPLRASCTSTGVTPPQTPAVAAGFYTAGAPSRDRGDLSTDSEDPLLSGVFRKTRNRSYDPSHTEPRPNDTPVLSMLPPGDALQWDELKESVADPEIDAFLLATDSLPAQPSEGLVAEAPTPFAPESYSDWSEKNSRGES